jgi:hypothetical protein
VSIVLNQRLKALETQLAHVVAQLKDKAKEDPACTAVVRAELEKYYESRKPGRPRKNE